MSLENILLGLLHRPACGYDLKNEFTDGINYFWSADMRQIYPTLKRMESDGLLKSRTEPSDKGPPKRVYSRTAKGTRQLRGWLRAGPELGAKRLPQLAQVLFLHELDDPEESIRFLEDYQFRNEPLVLLLEGAVSELRERGGDDLKDLTSEEVHDYLALQYGLQSITGQVQWCRESIGLIRARFSGKVTGRKSKATS